MKQKVLKVLANPARIFYVPYTLAVINFAVQFIIFIVLFLLTITISKGNYSFPPLYFLISLIIVHMILAFFSKREPQLGQIIASKMHLLKSKIPRKLVA